MGICTARVGAQPHEGVTETVTAEGTAARAETARVIRDYQRARDSFHAARSCLDTVMAHGCGLEIRVARYRYRRAVRRLSEAGERLVRAACTQPGLPASVMHTL